MTDAYLDLATTLVAEYNLQSHDAFVAAVAIATDVRDVIAIDRDFRRVDGITLWSL